MDDRTIQTTFEEMLGGFRPSRYVRERSLALYSAAITLAEENALTNAARFCLENGVASEQLYEVVLQSYLFLGFPRMLIAAERLHLVSPRTDVAECEDPRRDVDPDDWLERGQELCRRVYDGNYEALKSRVQSMAPEIFLWMELEGYGKVLSRPGLDIVGRETAIVACLTVENRRKQLHSHLKGALNVGAAPELLLDVVADLRPIAPEGTVSATDILVQLGVVS